MAIGRPARTFPGSPTRPLARVLDQFAWRCTALIRARRELHEGPILDGGNRYRACQHAGIESSFDEWRGEGLTAYVLSLNLHGVRREIDPPEPDPDPVENASQVE